LNHHLFLATTLALCLCPIGSAAAGTQPPAEYADYIAAIRKADAIKDPLQRCLAYPDLPGNTWAPGVAKARCTMFLTPPLYSLDDIERVLAQPDGAKALDAAFQTLLDAHFQESAKREQISIAFLVFHDKDRDKAERIARAWLAAAPGSAFARTALGSVLEARGWAARGSRYVRDTPAAKLQAMEAYFVEAAKLDAEALEKSPKLLPACQGLMSIGRQTSDEVQRFATAHCLEADPSSYYTIEELMTAAEPRWGGSDAAMRAVAAYAQARLAENPVLALFAFDNAYYAINRMDDGDEQAIAVLEPAALQVPNAAYLRLVGGAYLRKDNSWKTVVYLSQALRFSPDYGQELRYRAIALRDLGELQWARVDAEHAARDLTDGNAQLVLAEIVRKLDGEAAALPYLKRALDDPDTREYAYNDYCGILIDLGRPGEASRCIDDLLTEYPKNPEGWRQRLVAIGYDAPGSMEAMEQFLALNDPERWDYHAVAADTVRKVLAAKNGTASPSDLFDARLARGRAQEYTEVGRPYVDKLRHGTTGFMQGAFGACASAMKLHTAPRLEAVMDVLPDGRVANVAVRPENPWTACFARQIKTVLKLPPPPKLEGAAAYPLVYELQPQRKQP
jgi:tetratricopeptide (TPR) repeat protein